MRPEDLKFSETHEWVRINEKKKEATLGITDYAVKQLSDLVHLEITPKVGDALEKDAPFGEIESVKTVADLISPLTGKIHEINEELTEHVETLKDDPYDEGWMIKVKYTEPKDLEGLMDAKEYREYLESLEEEEEDGKGEKEEAEEVDEDDFM